MRTPQAQEAVQLSPGGWLGQPASPRRNALRSSHLAARAEATFARHRSWCGLEGRGFCGGGRSGRPQALRCKVLREDSWYRVAENRLKIKTRLTSVGVGRPQSRSRPSPGWRKRSGRHSGDKSRRARARAPGDGGCARCARWPAHITALRRQRPGTS